MLNVTLIGDRELIQKLNAMPSKVHAALLRKVTELAFKLESKIKADKLSGQVLNVRTGALRASIANQVTETVTTVTGRAFSSGDVKYAAIHEFGGKIPAREIVATKAQALAFVMGGKQVFAKSVQFPGAIMPERSFMRSSLADMKPEIVEGLTEAVREGLKK
jgi:HK97 gp10 family phage protein